MNYGRAAAQPFFWPARGCNPTNACLFTRLLDVQSEVVLSTHQTRTNRRWGSPHADRMVRTIEWAIGGGVLE